jgi:ABC-type glycerol-3-phosphate transport system substrate-binding protein
MNRLISCIAALAAALALAACGERDEPEISTTTQSQFEITGSWRGELTQQGMKPFPVQATIASLERFKDNTVHYGGIDCSGTWEYLGASDTAYRFHEVITSGKSAKCKGQGTVSLTPTTENSVAYEFSGGGVTSKGDLQRISPAKAG